MNYFLLIHSNLLSKHHYLLVQNYGLAIIIFSVLIKLAMLPLSIKQQKTLKKNEKVQKEMKILQIKHKGNPERLNQEMMELYKREKINPFGGCFSVIIQFILLLAMFSLVRSPLTFMKQIEEPVITEKIEEIKKENGENSISRTYPEMSVIKYVQEKNMTDSPMYLNMDFLGLDLSNVPQENYTDIKVFIIPVLYVISSIASIKLTTKVNSKKEIDKSNALTNTEDNKELDQEEMAQQMNKTMSLMMPILSVSISLVAPLGLALYWLVNNIIMIIERLILNKMFSKEEEENG